jgi:hypothetical protein
MNSPVELIFSKAKLIASLCGRDLNLEFAALSPSGGGFQEPHVRRVDFFSHHPPSRF